MGKNFIMVLKGVFFALLTSLACVLMFALVLKIFSLPNSCIKPINQVIKVLAIFIGCLVALKGEKVLLKGGAVGLLAGISEYLAFGAISKNFNFSSAFFIDAAFAAAIGVIFSLIFNFFRKK